MRGLVGREVRKRVLLRVKEGKVTVMELQADELAKKVEFSARNITVNSDGHVRY